MNTTAIAERTLSPSNFSMHLHPESRDSHAFSLPELAIALGILAFAFIGLLGLLPAGMDTFRKSMDASVTSYISHRLVSEIQLADFKNAIKPINTNKFRHFDDEGQPLDDNNGDLPPANAVRMIYQANVVITPEPKLPGSSDSNTNLATVTIQVANNPVRKNLGPAGQLWDPEVAKQLRVPVVTYSTVISGNNPQKP